MNFFSDQEGIMTRYLREKTNWDSHVQHTKNFMINALQDEEIQNVAILGSGWLLDLPLAYLAERFEQILLLDIHHPPQIKNSTQKYPNILFQEIDLTGGGIEHAWNMRKAKTDSLENLLNDFEPVIPDLAIDVDAFISVNILNQLDILLVDYLKDINSALTEDHFHTFRKKIQQFHVGWISSKPGCLISDIVEMNFRDGEMTESYDLQHVNLPGSFRSESWIWDFDLSGFYHRDRQTKMKVKAIEW